MKKILTVLLALALVTAFILPAAAAKLGDNVDFRGYVKWETAWDSKYNNKNETSYLFRNNVPNINGRFGMTANSTRFAFAISGPEVLGAMTEGYIEMDFDAQGSAPMATSEYSHTGDFRMRHAWFRMRWPYLQLLFGQYWSPLADWTPETCDNGAMQFTGWPGRRAAQIRITKFLGPWTLVGAVVNPNNLPDSSGQADPVNAELSSWPQLSGSVTYEKDLYGKAPYYGRPKGFTAQISVGVQGNRYLRWTNNQGVSTFGQNNYVNIFNARQTNNQTLNPWIIQGTLFIPVLVTHTESLAKTASVIIQANVGEGLGAFGAAVPMDSTIMRYDYTSPNSVFFNRKLVKRYSGFITGQYYFNNQWFIVGAYGFSKSFGIDKATMATPALATPTNYSSNNNDPTKFWQVATAALFFRPNQNLKFGVQYSYQQTAYYQPITIGSTITAVGNNHRVMCAGFFFF